MRRHLRALEELQAMKTDQWTIPTATLKWQLPLKVTANSKLPHAFDISHVRALPSAALGVLAPPPPHTLTSTHAPGAPPPPLHARVPPPPSVAPRNPAAPRRALDRLGVRWTSEAHRLTRARRAS